jgi:hypothetical protein
MTQITHPNLSNIEVMGNRLTELESLIEKAIRGLVSLDADEERDYASVGYMFQYSENEALAYDDKNKHNPNANILELKAGVYFSCYSSTRKYIEFKLNSNGFGVYLFPEIEQISMTYSTKGELITKRHMPYGNYKFTKQFNEFCLDLEKHSSEINTIKDLCYEFYNLVDVYEDTIKKTELEMKANLINTVTTGQVYQLESKKIPKLTAHITKRTGDLLWIDYYAEDTIFDRYVNIPVKDYAEKILKLPTKKFTRYANSKD